MDMLTKPFALEALGAKVRAMVERSKSGELYSRYVHTGKR
jgi:DNA-binding response OmpR family regulator